MNLFLLSLCFDVSYDLDRCRKKNLFLYCVEHITSKTFWNNSSLFLPIIIVVVICFFTFFKYDKQHLLVIIKWMNEWEDMNESFQPITLICWNRLNVRLCCFYLLAQFSIVPFINYMEWINTITLRFIILPSL